MLGVYDLLILVLLLQSGDYLWTCLFSCNVIYCNVLYCIVLYCIVLYFDSWLMRIDHKRTNESRMKQCMTVIQTNIERKSIYSLLPFAPCAPALDNTNNIIWCVTRAWCLRTDRTSALLTNIGLHCERACGTILTIRKHQCASANIVDNSLKNVHRNVSI